MGMMIVRHKVKDYSKWRPMFDAHVEKQKAAGLSHPKVLRSADDKSELVIIFDDMDTKKAKEFAGSKDLKETMMKAGVIDVPTIYFLESV
jgi:hypothetical protein